MTDDVATRIRAFRREAERRCATLTEPTAFGTAFLNLDLPRRWDSNVVWVERSLAGVDADALAADADRVLGEHGLEHRQIVVDDDLDARRLAIGFLELGWSAERLLVMVRSRDAEPRPDARVREVGFDQARPILEAIVRRQPFGTSEEIVRELVGARALFERALDARFFVADADGTPASVCELYTIGDVAQVEDVNTLEGFRGRGFASAVILSAVTAARERGCDLVFLVADDADWPKDLYVRLGFDPVSRFWSFLRTPS